LNILHELTFSVRNPIYSVVKCAETVYPAGALAPRYYTRNGGKGPFLPPLKGVDFLAQGVMTFLPLDWIAAGLGNALWLAWSLQTASYGVTANYLLMGALNARTLWTWVREARATLMQPQLTS
jgi:hypothetical protein